MTKPSERIEELTDYSELPVDENYGYVFTTEQWTELKVKAILKYLDEVHKEEQERIEHFNNKPKTGGSN